jgi:hypothetical protein
MENPALKKHMKLGNQLLDWQRHVRENCGSYNAMSWKQLEVRFKKQGLHTSTGTCLASNISALFPARAITVFGFPVLKQSRIRNYICQLIYIKTSCLDTSSATMALTRLNFVEQTIAT